MSIRKIGNKGTKIIEKRFWFGYFSQKELVCTMVDGKCYWKMIYWMNDIEPGCRHEEMLTKDKARELLKQYGNY